MGFSNGRDNAIISLNQSKYPENNPFTLKQNHTKYKYHIINKEFYPLQNKIHYTSATSHSGNKYKILEGYLVQTSWGRSKSHHIVEYEIEYEQDGLVFIIRFEENSLQYVLKSKKSPTAVANDYLQKKYSDTHVTISGIHIFGLNVTDVDRECNKKKRRSLSFKPFNELSESMKTKRSCAFSLYMGKSFDYEVPKFFNSLDNPNLQEIKFNIQDKNYVINYNKYDKENDDRSLDPFLKVIDQGPISHHAYRKLAVIQPELP
ncbi:27921_t:CDS:2 [Dentiscutata erythropus]|uniref:27921_t:CDS:1 n=1 Tax=Dentiscutata erythropus TaxID=1348616 RepID=A0A9N9DJ56_9GLOM|nr:27921_t:CDS:2 [Dentiscutata erythropus]